MSRRHALDRGAYFIDNTTAATFRLRPKSGKKRETPRSFERGHFIDAREKFRDFKIKKGKNIPLMDAFIEKRGRRIDTLGELTGLSLARLKKQTSLNTKVPNLLTGSTEILGVGATLGLTTPKKRRKRR